MAYTDEFGNIYEDDALSGDSGSSFDNFDYSYGSSGYGFADANDPYEITNTATNPGEPGYNWKYYSDGTSISPDGKYYYQGDMVYDVNNPSSGVLANILGKTAASALKGAFVNKDGTPNLAGIGSLGMGLYGLLNKDKQGGYNKPVPKMDMVREQIQYNDPNRRPGEAGRQYFTDPRYAAQGDAEALAAAKTASADQASGIQAAYQPRPAPAPNPYAGKMKMAYNPPVADTSTAGAQAAALPQIPNQLTAQGGIPMAQGGLADAGRYLQGKTDGMADEIPSSIDGEQPAALSHGEFVIPADVVSHLGNGNSDAGAQKLYEMMDRIRQARTGTTDQGKEINPDEFTMGGLAAAYAGGGAVKGFNGADNVSAVSGPVTPAPAQTAAGLPQDVSRTSTLSPWVGDYVTNALGQGAALAAAPYQAYQGPLTAGASNLQQQAFAGASEMAEAGYTPGQFTGGFGVQQAQQYMNPYLQASLDPQLKELQRQSDIARMADAGRLTKAGAFGGSRQAIMESEGRRNLLDKQQDVLGTGYKTAYDLGLGQFNKEREAEEASRQYGAGFGLKSVGQLADLGAIERGITSEGLAADKAQFEEQRDFAYGMPKYQLGLLSGLPIGANTTAVDQDALGKLQTQFANLGTNYTMLDKALKELGQAPATPAK
jgi:hypothetical protein